MAWCRGLELGQDIKGVVESHMESQMYSLTEACGLRSYV